LTGNTTLEIRLPFRRRAALGSTSALAMLLAMAPVAHAQQADVAAPETAATDASAEKDREIVVTGTLIRGIAPVGTNVIGVTTKDIAAKGVASTVDLMSTIPQISSFNAYQAPSAGFGQPIAQTNLRGLGASGGTTTLLLVNGHRIVGSGILQTYPDPTVIPPNMIERVEVIPDGGSSIYGSDAIGGVINFITRKHASGIEVDGKIGFSGGYRTVDGSIFAGKEWTGGSLMLSYSYAWHNNIQGGSQPYVSQNNTAQGGTDRRVSTCALTNIIANGVTYAQPNLVAGTVNKCDTSQYADIYPREQRHSAYAALDQDLTDNLHFNMSAYYSRRDTTTLTAPLATNGTITSANPYFQPIGTATTQSVLFNYTSVFGAQGLSNPARFESWGLTPTFEWKLGHNWNLKAMGNYGHSFNSTTERAINNDVANAALASTSTATALNPYILSQTNPTVLAAIRDYQNYSQAKQDLGEVRLVADGPVVSLPGGDARLAVGAEYHHEGIESRIAFGPTATPKQNAVAATRNVKSVYGEVFVPVFGNSNAVPGIAGFDLTGSVRYDSYDDVGGTTNPKIGFSYRPVRWMTVRGNWGTSFHAPSLADTSGAVDERVTSIPVATNLAPGSVASDAFRPVLYISGGNPTLKPETAHTWSLGTDIKPPIWDALTLSATYYNVDFRNAISVNSGYFSQGAAYWADPSNTPYYIRNPTLAQATAFSRGARADNFSSLAGFFGANNPYAILDLRRYNLGQLSQDGIDFAANINQRTGFGAITASFAGTYTLDRNSKTLPTSPVVDQLKNGFTHLNFIASLGTQVKGLTARATLTHSGGYPIIGDVSQSRVASFNPIDLYLAYEMKLAGGHQATVTLNINNIANAYPPYRNSGNGYANGSTLGRLVSVGLRTKL